MDCGIRKSQFTVQNNISGILLPYSTMTPFFYSMFDHVRPYYARKKEEL